MNFQMMGKGAKRVSGILTLSADELVFKKPNVERYDQNDSLRELLI